MNLVLLESPWEEDLNHTHPKYVGGVVQQSRPTISPSDLTQFSVCAKVKYIYLHSSVIVFWLFFMPAITIVTSA